MHHARLNYAGTILPLYVNQFATFLVPVVTVPFLARTLKLPGWGQLAFVQSFAAFIAIFIEYGVSFSGTRLVAEARKDPVRVSRVLSGVQGAKLLLAICAGVVCCAIRSLVPMLAASPLLFWAGLLWAIGQAMNLSWFFLGLEQGVAVATLTDLTLKFAAAGAIFLFVRGPEDAWIVLALQAGALMTSAVVCWCVAARGLPRTWPSPTSVGEALRQGRSAMVFRMAESSYTVGGPMFLGLFCGPVAVGIYAGAEKVCRAVMLSVLEPLQRSLYASATNHMQNSRAAAAALVRHGALWTLALASMVSAGAFVFAPLIIRVALGAAFLPCIAVLRVLCVVPPAVALKWSLGIQWMMTGGLGPKFARIVLGSCVLYIVIGAWLATRAGAMGLAITTVLVEVAIPLACAISTQRAGLSLFRQGKQTVQLVGGSSAVTGVQ